MDIATALRRFLAEYGPDQVDFVQGCYRLTVTKLADAPRCLAFALSEARPHGWWPVLAGRVDERNQLILTAGEPAELPILPQLVALLLTSAGPAKARRRPRPATRTIVESGVPHLLAERGS